jgi:hypothetical protein
MLFNYLLPYVHAIPHSLSLSFSLFPFSVTLSPSLCLNLLTAHSPSMPPSVSPLSHSLFPFLSPSLVHSPLSLSLYHNLSPLTVFLSLAFFVFTSNVLPPSIDLSLSLPLSLTLPFNLPYSVSLSHSQSISLSFSLSICIPLSVLSSLSCPVPTSFSFSHPLKLSLSLSLPLFICPLSLAKFNKLDIKSSIRCPQSYI